MANEKIKINKKLLEEFAWDDSELNSDSIDNDEESYVEDKIYLEAHKKAENTLNSLQFFEKLEKKINNLYDDILDKDSDLHLFSAKVQRIELEKLSLALKSKDKEEDSEISTEEELKKELNKLFNSESNDILKIFQIGNVQNNRKELYQLYDEIADINYIAYRMLRVYMDNILIKNMNTKGFLTIELNAENKLINKENEQDIDYAKKLLGLLISYFDIQKKLKNDIIPKTLKYGDFYIEIVNLAPVNKLIKKLDNIPELIQENNHEYYDNNGKKRIIKNLNLAIFENHLKVKNKNIKEEIFEHTGKISTKAKIKKLKSKIFDKRQIEEFDLSFLQTTDEDEKTLKDFIDLDFDELDNIYLRYLDPSQVIKITHNGVNYGYLVIEEIEKDQDNETEINIYKRFLSDDNNSSSGDSDTEKAKEISDLISDKVSERIIEAIREKDINFDDLDDEVKLSLKIIIYNKIKEKAKLKFRLLDAKSIVNFHTQIDKYSPYGTSVFDPIVQPVKMYTLGLMTSIISRLSRASIIRKWNIEVGNKRNYQQIIEQVKKDLKNKSVTFNDLTNIKNITKILTDFRDIATITRDGQRYIDLEILPTHDRSLPIQELQDLRNELIMATGIPAVYLNSMDTIDLRETLVNMNINFANTIITLQSFIEDSINELFNNIVETLFELNGEDSDGFLISQYFKIKLNPPIILQVQSTEGLVGSIANILGVLQNVNVQVDPLELFEKYIPGIDWRALKKSGEKIVQDEVKKQIIQQMPQAGGNGGGF